MPEVVIGPREIRRLARLHGLRVRLNRHDAARHIWLIHNDARGWYIPRGCYLLSDIQILLAEIKTYGWERSVRATNDTNCPISVGFPVESPLGTEILGVEEFGDYW
jgi:hypothetical protein